MVYALCFSRQRCSPRPQIDSSSDEYKAANATISAAVATHLANMKIVPNQIVSAGRVGPAGSGRVNQHQLTGADACQRRSTRFTL